MVTDGPSQGGSALSRLQLNFSDLPELWRPPFGGLRWEIKLPTPNAKISVWVTQILKWDLIIIWIHFVKLQNLQNFYISINAWRHHWDHFEILINQWIKLWQLRLLSTWNKYYLCSFLLRGINKTWFNNWLWLTGRWCTSWRSRIPSISCWNMSFSLLPPADSSKAPHTQEHYRNHCFQHWSVYVHTLWIWCVTSLQWSLPHKQHGIVIKTHVMKQRHGKNSSHTCTLWGLITPSISLTNYCCCTR